MIAENLIGVLLKINSTQALTYSILNMRKIKISSFTIIFCLMANIAFSQKNILKQDMIWASYSLKLQTSPKITVGVAYQDRYLMPFRIHHRLTTVGVAYKISEQWTVEYNQMLFFLSLPQDGAQDIEVSIPELRPMQVVTHHPKSAGKWSLVYRFMLEERFIRKHSEKALQDGYNFNFRFRYLFGGALPLIYSKKEETPQKKVSLNLSGEFMLNYGKIIENTFNQSRLIAGGSYHINPNLQLNLSYIHWFLQRNTGANYVRWDILQVSLAQKIKLY